MTQATGSPQGESPPRPDWISIALIAVGAVLILWGVLRLSSAGYSKTGREFSERRPYNQVKVDVHKAFPGALLRAGMGAALVYAGMRRRSAKA